jgi:hypothetical protein
VETAFDHLKTTMKMDVLHCQTVEGVLKELTMFVLVYNLVRMTMLEAGTSARSRSRPNQLCGRSPLASHRATFRGPSQTERDSTPQRSPGTPLCQTARQKIPPAYLASQPLTTTSAPTTTTSTIYDLAPK